MSKGVEVNPLKKSKMNFKRKVAKATGIPTTKSGRKRKMDAMHAQLVLWLIVIGVLVYIFSGDSEAATFLQ